ncbi:helix-turn-helix domain-containing protein [Cohnella rhizosphaerae]|uniref:AraC family transcriptional regulator n=1 Tax=Cohnella rhizosphaerae TaxID=1457232 RepID=A0A9X4QSR4_9BACL|nr:helix-turn-helix domain-containing protein [Cohnella rhizosphaerae]MDG0809579.1 AraC family transcriptional regulator [Cohnella rhizosphaerae]
MFRVVIVEDEPPILRSIKEKIAAIDPDFKVVGEYYNGAAALLEMDIVQPHVLITDLHMPVMDGEALLERVRERYPDMLCVILTGYQQFEYARMAVRMGVVDYLLKPPTEATIGELLVSLRRRLLQNQTLVESFILQRLLLPHSSVAHADAELERYAREYFYHASYMLLYAWLPPELERDFPAAQLRNAAEAWLQDGERCYALAAPSHECILLLGVHELGGTRLGAWAAAGGPGGPDSAAVLAIPLRSGGIAGVPGALQLARRAAPQLSRMAGAAFAVLSPGEGAGEPPRAELPAAAVSHMAAFVRKRRKPEFMQALTAAIGDIGLGSLPRSTWIRTLQRLARELTPHAGAAETEGVPERMENEIAQAIWGAAQPEIALAHLTRIFGRLCEEDGSDEESAGWPEEVEAYLKANFTSNLSLADLAERFGLNPSYLSFVFKSKRGKSPGDYLIELRIEEAKRLIREFPRLLFKDIAEQVGYPDPYYFSKLFKQWAGMTPTEYKRGQRFD